VISGFRRKEDEICDLMGYYAAYSGDSLKQVSGQPIGSIFKGQDTDP
jgi:hypothetical protein